MKPGVVETRISPPSARTMRAEAGPMVTSHTAGGELEAVVESLAVGV